MNAQPSGRRDGNGLPANMLFTFIVALATTVHVEAQRPAAPVDLCRDTVTTLVGMRAEELAVCGFHLGMTDDEAWARIRQDARFLGSVDDANRSRLYVYKRNDDGSQGMALLYLIWNPDDERMNRVTVFPPFSEYLARAFRILLSPVAYLGMRSSDLERLIGAENRVAVTLDIPVIGLRNVTRYRDALGIEVTQRQDRSLVSGVFALVTTSP